MNKDLSQILQDAKLAIKLVSDEQQLNQFKSKFLGKKSEVSTVLKSLKQLSGPEKRELGRLANVCKSEISNLIADRKMFLAKNEVNKYSEFDFTKPFAKPLGSLHPITTTAKQIIDIMKCMGFMVVDGLETVDDYHNFLALNYPENHPARDMQDTYWLENGKLLRTQTSACQVMAIEKYGAPLRIISPGRCFRNEDIDASHENTFFQLEGMYIDRNVSIKNLIYVMKQILAKVFNREVVIRLRPGYFPFVEPGFEMDINCLICNGVGCSTCKQSGWLELLPCGMVHPNVLELSGVDANEFNGFAFGLGLTRLAMMKYKISDIRVLNSGDLDKLDQFSICC